MDLRIPGSPVEADSFLLEAFPHRWVFPHKQVAFGRWFSLHKRAVLCKPGAPYNLGVQWVYFPSLKQVWDVDK